MPHLSLNIALNPRKHALCYEHLEQRSNSVVLKKSKLRREEEEGGG
jgi:hypothetical protein